MGSFVGAVALVLNAHFPYVRRSGLWPHGEEALYEVIAESYLPLLGLLHDLRATGQSVPFSLAVSPILVEQLGDPIINQHFALWLDEQSRRARSHLEKFEASGEGHLAYLCRFYLQLAETVADTFEKRYAGNIAHGLRDLIGDQIELLLAPATAAYLPRLDPGALRAQIQTGALSILQWAHRRARGLWLPYGGFHSDLTAQLDALGVHFVVAPSGDGPNLGSVEGSEMFIVRGDREVIQHVLAPGLGYPGDSLYRDFYRTDEDLGLHFWRVTGVDVPLDKKALYDPYPAFERAEEHARHWLKVLYERLRWLSHMEQPPVVVVTLDAEFFGHWWFEGIAWLRFVLRELHASEEIRTLTLSKALAEWHHLAPPCPAQQAADCSPDVEIAELWRRLEVANRRMGRAARAYMDAEGLQERLLTQAARELLLAASGDWFALIANGSAVDYARRRFDEHLARFEQLLIYAQSTEPPPDAESYLARIAELDNPFPRINFRIWG